MKGYRTIHDIQREEEAEISIEGRSVPENLIAQIAVGLAIVVLSTIVFAMINYLIFSMSK